MCTVTFMPGLRVRPAVLVSAILTGMTWVTFWKLPVVLSWGKGLKVVAALSWISSTVPVTGLPGYESTSMSTSAPRCTPLTSVSSTRAVT